MAPRWLGGEKHWDGPCLVSSRRSAVALGTPGLGEGLLGGESEGDAEGALDCDGLASGWRCGGGRGEGWKAFRAPQLPDEPWMMDGMCRRTNTHLATNGVARQVAAHPRAMCIDAGMFSC